MARFGTHVLGAIALLFCAQSAGAVTIFFDGAEAGIGLNDTTFSFEGSNWSGGQVSTLGDTPLYHSGTRSYMVASPGSGAGQVTFDTPVIDVSLAFLHGGNFSSAAAGTAMAFDSGDNLLETLNSMFVNNPNPATLMSFTTITPIARIDFVEGTVDTFSYTVVPEPATGLLVVSALAGLAAVRRKRAS